ncbi:MAG: GPP34 family phosphoprotein [Micromonosporaceae bacterium]|nr:GPP34 family phosphoprotein [Micromonosporaceae bacterium]
MAAADGGAHRPQQPGGSAGLRPGSLTLAGDLFLIMLDDATGRLRVHEKAAGYALAGVLLIEAWATGHLAIGAGQVRVVGHRPPEDPLVHRILGWIMTEPEQTHLDAWVRFLATVAVGTVADQVTAAGWIVQERRRFSGRRVLFAPTDRNAVFWRAGRLARQLRCGPTWADAVCCALLDAVGAVAQTIGGLGDADTPALIEAAVGWLRQSYPEVAAVCGQVQALSARAAISLR